MEHCRLTIAVVDDDAAMRKALGRLLRLVGFEVATYSSAEEFLARGSSDRPGCLILDIHLEGMSGLELRENLAKTGGPIPVVFITAHDDAPTEASLREAPDVPCLRKPFDETLLFDAIGRVTGGRLTPVRREASAP